MLIDGSLVVYLRPTGLATGGLCEEDEEFTRRPRGSGGNATASLTDPGSIVILTEQQLERICVL